MKAKKDHSQSKWRSIARKVVCGASAAGMCMALLPATALASDVTSKYYSLPSANSVVSFEHQGTGKNGSTYTYRYVTVGGSATGRVAPMMQTWYEVLGLNYTDAYNGVDTIYGRSKAEAWDTDRGTVTSDNKYTRGSQGSYESRNSSLAILTGNNEQPDEYIWNYCAWANGANVPVDSRAIDHGNSGVGSYTVTVGGSDYSNFPREVYMECDILGANSGVAGSGTISESEYAEWVKLENQRSNRPKTGTYDPSYAHFSINAGGGAKMVSVLHSVADSVDSIIAKSADSNGNYTLQSRYGGNTASGTGAVIDKYEDIVQATQYYTLSKIADGTVKRATTAVLVGYDPSTGYYACRKFNASNPTDKDPDGNQYGGRVANFLADISDSITDKVTPVHGAYNDAESNYIAWYTPKQIVENCDAAFVCDAYSANNISTYLATASDGKPHTVYTPTDATHDEEDNTGGLTSARTTALAAGKDVADFCFSYPCNMFGNFYAQGVENGMLAPITCAFTYPKLFDLTDMIGYWAKNVWHIKDSAVQDIVTSTAENMDLSGDQKIGTLSSNYQTTAERIFAVGNQYYLKHTSAIDAINGGNLKTYNLDSLKSRTPEGLVTGEEKTQGSGATKATYTATSNSSKNKTVTYTKSEATGSTVTIPATVKIDGVTYKVTKVAANAITSSKVKTVTVGKNVTTINAKAFNGASKLTTVTLGSGVKTIKAKAFNNLKSLKKVTIGKSAKKLPKATFYKTPKLNSLVVKSKKLAKKSAVKNALKGSKITAKKLTVKHSGVSKKQLKKAFTQKNLGAPSTVKVVVK